MSQQTAAPHTVSDLEVVDQMTEFGGGFVKQLAAAFRVADPMNRQRIVSAFPEIWSVYADAATSFSKVSASSHA